MSRIDYHRMALDTLSRAGFSDDDGYAWRLATAYEGSLAQSRDRRKRDLERIMTSSIRGPARARFLERLFVRLESFSAARGGGAEPSNATSDEFLLDFAQHVRRQGIQSFWESRAAGRMVNRAESRAEDLLLAFIAGDRGRTGRYAINQVKSGIGFIDVMMLSTDGSQDLVELKVVRRPDERQGEKQLARYLVTENLEHGYLLVFDATGSGHDDGWWTRASVGTVTVSSLTVDINPARPSDLG